MTKEQFTVDIRDGGFGMISLIAKQALIDGPERIDAFMKMIAEQYWYDSGDSMKNSLGTGLSLSLERLVPKSKVKPVNERNKNQQTMYDLVWVVEGKVKEVILQNKPIAICKWKASQLKSTTHKLGLLQERKVTDRPVHGWR